MKKRNEPDPRVMRCLRDIRRTAKTAEDADFCDVITNTYAHECREGLPTNGDGIVRSIKVCGTAAAWRAQTEATKALFHYHQDKTKAKLNDWWDENLEAHALREADRRTRLRRRYGVFYMVWRAVRRRFGGVDHPA